MVVNKEISPRFEDFIFDWDYETYLLLGSYGSGKSYHIVLKIILKCLEEKRKVLVVREVYETHKESTFDLFREILDSMGLLERMSRRGMKSNKVREKLSPLGFEFPNGSRIIFKGMDDPQKLKSVNDVSIVWLEEASEVKYAGYKELMGRLRHPFLSMHFILSLNPVGQENWVFKHFFIKEDSSGKKLIRLDDNELYKRSTIVKRGTYYHHSLCEDNMFLPFSYIKRLDELKEYDPDLYRVARLGQFGIVGKRVLPQFTIANSHEEVMSVVNDIPRRFHFRGFDFGFEESYNALVWLAVDDKNKYLYIFDEYYKNHMTDDRTAEELKDFYPLLLNEMIIADSAEPKAIQFYRQEGFQMRGARKATRVEQVRKMKRFKKIICSPNCENVIAELKGLTYARDKNGEAIYDEFNIDPHTFSAMWYALDNYTVADVKEVTTNSRKGGDPLQNYMRKGGRAI